MKKTLFLSISLLFIAFLGSSCKKGNGINVFTVAQDKEFGAQLKAQIDSTPSQNTDQTKNGNEKA